MVVLPGGLVWIKDVVYVRGLRRTQTNTKWRAAVVFHVCPAARLTLYSNRVQTCRASILWNSLTPLTLSPSHRSVYFFLSCFAARLVRSFGGGGGHRTGVQAMRLLKNREANAAIVLQKLWRKALARMLASRLRR